MATIGRKKKSKRQQKIRVLKGARFQQFVKNYKEAIARGELKPIKEIEDLLAKWGNVFDKNGNPKKSAFKSNKRRKEFNKDMREFNKRHKKWGKEEMKRIAQEQKAKRDKQANTFGENQARRAVEEATEAGETVSVDFEQIAREESENYLRMLDLFAMDSLNKLREELNIGSPVVRQLAKMGLTTEVIDQYLQDFRNAYMDLPQEARDLAKQDDLDKAIVALASLHGEDNLTDVLRAFIEADSEEEREQVAEAGQFHAMNDTSTSFADFWSEARGTSSIKWGDFL